MTKNHTFVVLAYKESEYLEKCIQSVFEQSVKSNVVIATSTRNDFIENIADKYSLKIIENPEPGKGIAHDFDFALACVDSQYVTIAHQDDVYSADYLKSVSENVPDDMLIACTDYHELREDVIQKYNSNLFIKRLMLLPLGFEALQGNRFIKRACLSLGNPICCPSVTFNKTLVKNPLFVSDFRSNMDWYAWEKLSKLKGRFVYVNKPLMTHRIHSSSTTSEMIDENKRTKEDYEMLEKFWPQPIAKMIAKIYKQSEKNNG